MIAMLPNEWHEAWQERAAILEFDGGMSRAGAEAAALREVMEKMQRSEK